MPSAQRSILFWSMRFPKGACEGRLGNRPPSGRDGTAEAGSLRSMATQKGCDRLVIVLCPGLGDTAPGAPSGIIPGEEGPARR